MTLQEIESSKKVVNRDPTEDRQIGTGTGETDKSGRTQADRLTGAALDVVLVEVEMLEGEGRTGITAEVEVREGGSGNNTTTPNQDGQRKRGSGQNCWDRGRLS